MVKHLKPANGLVIDRHYRGAIVMTARSHYALAEASILMLERISKGSVSPELCSTEEREILSTLSQIGVLVAKEQPSPPAVEVEEEA